MYKQNKIYKYHQKGCVDTFPLPTNLNLRDNTRNPETRNKHESPSQLNTNPRAKADH